MVNLTGRGEKEKTLFLKSEKRPEKLGELKRRDNDKDKDYYGVDSNGQTQIEKPTFDSNYWDYNRSPSPCR